ncbi:hypothetical protein [Streptomyces sp. NPDC051776]|uniref:hypothetical protein n=1 Tax=Streptomyces sp. NPDC051776 TaxID=3155414 RepID=UPI003415FC02
MGTLHGLYAGNLSGSSGTRGPSAAQVLVDFNGDGTGKVEMTYTNEASEEERFTHDLAYTLDGDCTGMIRLLESVGEQQWQIAVTSSGEKVHIIRTNPPGRVYVGQIESVSRPTGGCSEQGRGPGR